MGWGDMRRVKVVEVRNAAVGRAGEGYETASRAVVGERKVSLVAE